MRRLHHNRNHSTASSGQWLWKGWLLKFARLIDVDPTQFDYLDSVPAQELQTLRESVTTSIFDANEQTLKRIAAAAKLIPSPLIATIAKRSFGPLLCARAAGAIDPAKALDIAKRLPADFLADVTVQLDPRRVAKIISRVPEALVVPVAAERGKRAEHVTMGRFLAYLPDRATVAAMTTLSDEDLLRTAFVLENKDHLDRALGLLPPERLASIIANASQLGLWPAALDLLDHLSDARRGPVADVVADLDEESIAALVGAVTTGHLWPKLLPVVRTMSDQSRSTMAAMPPFHQKSVLRDILTTAASSGLWVDLVPLLRALPAPIFAQIPQLVVELPDSVSVALVIEAVASVDLLEPLVEILSGMDETVQQSIVCIIESDDGSLGRVLVGALKNPDHIRLLLEHTPADILDAIEHATDRHSLHAELGRPALSPGCG